MPRLTRKAHIEDATGDSAVGLAVADLRRDLDRTLDSAGPDAPAVRIDVALDPGLGGVEQYRVQVGAESIEICGSDRLGAIYGLYAFSERCLGVDPLWFWKDVLPDPRPFLDLEERVLRSRPFTFRYRGWFINDEDLLTEWREGSGPRFIEYPYYHTVIDRGIAEAVFEAALRCRANLVIPASFIDVMNPSEAWLIQRAAERGLYVTQHHIEALGVSHFGFENYWKARGRTEAFSYGQSPETVREVWRAFAERWAELAGDRVVWQLGLRGKGDRPIWDSDRSVTRADAIGMISRAMSDQARIVRETDPRPAPPMTTTLWHEMSELMSTGELEIPEETIVVFSDYGPTQEMQADFRDAPRTARAGYGVYYHLAMWGRGPHLVQGIDPSRMERALRAVAMKGDTAYIIFNVSNIREHVLGVQAGVEMTADLANWDLGRFMERFAGPLAADYAQFFSALAPLDTGPLQDGDAARLVSTWLGWKEQAEPAGDPFAAYGLDTPDRRRRVERWIEARIAVLDSVAAGLPGDVGAFHRLNLGVQAEMLASLYRALVALFRAHDGLGRVSGAVAHLDRFLAVRGAMEQGRWAHWYRGDRKANWPLRRQRLAEIDAYDGGGVHVPTVSR